MIELKRRSGSGEPSHIFSSVPNLNPVEVSGYIEQWYFGDAKWNGIRVAKFEDLTYAELVGRGQGTSLGERGFYGIGDQDKCYDESSYLVNGSVLTVSTRKENFGRGEPTPLIVVDRTAPKKPTSIMRVSKTMPEKIVAILAEKKDRVLETAEMLRLPLEETVSFG